MKRFSVHLIEYQSIFRNKTKVCFDKAELYTQGIIKSHMRNIERISEELGANYHQMQHFITESNWNGREVIDKVAKGVSASLPKNWCNDPAQCNEAGIPENERLFKTKLELAGEIICHQIALQERN